MSTKWCAQCGSEYVARVEVCPDCGVELRLTEPDEAERADQPEAADVPVLQSDDLYSFDFSEDSAEFRRHLAQLVQGHIDPALGTAIPHSWQGTVLTVHVERFDLVSELVEETHIVLGQAVDPDAPKLAYDVSDLPDELLTELFDALVEAEIPADHDLYTGELIVQEADEERVQEILDAVDFPDELPADEDATDGLSAQEVLSDLFVAADRLRKRADDPDGVLTMARAAQAAASMPVPYGFAEADWKAIADGAASMHQLLESDAVDDESDAAIRDAADAFRAQLRPYV